MVGTGTATANVDDTVTAVTVDLTASTVDEGGSADYVFTATLSSASHGVTTIHTDQGDITIADGATTGTLTIASGNGEDVYSDASSLTASITGVSGGGFESLVVGTGTATANVDDTVTAVTVDLTASTVDEGSSADYVFTATLSSPRTASPPSTPTRAISASPTARRPAPSPSPPATARTSIVTPPA